MMDGLVRCPVHGKLLEACADCILSAVPDKNAQRGQVVILRLEKQLDVFKAAANELAGALEEIRQVIHGSRCDGNHHNPACLSILQVIQNYGRLRSDNPPEPEPKPTRTCNNCGSGIQECRCLLGAMRCRRCGELVKRTGHDSDGYGVYVHQPCGFTMEEDCDDPRKEKV